MSVRSQSNAAGRDVPKLPPNPDFIVHCREHCVQPTQGPIASCLVSEDAACSGILWSRCLPSCLWSPRVYGYHLVMCHLTHRCTLNTGALDNLLSIPPSVFTSLPFLLDFHTYMLNRCFHPCGCSFPLVEKYWRVAISSFHSKQLRKFCRQLKSIVGVLPKTILTVWTRKDQSTNRPATLSY